MVFQAVMSLLPLYWDCTMPPDRDRPLMRIRGRELLLFQKNTDIKILVTLSCTMCPELVVAAQRIAAENSYVTAPVYDIRQFEDLKNRYKVMSVPCLVINDEKIAFGKKNIQQVLDLIRR